MHELVYWFLGTLGAIWMGDILLLAPYRWIRRVCKSFNPDIAEDMCREWTAELDAVGMWRRWYDAGAILLSYKQGTYRDLERGKDTFDVTKVRTADPEVAKARALRHEEILTKQIEAIGDMVAFAEKQRYSAQKMGDQAAYLEAMKQQKQLTDQLEIVKDELRIVEHICRRFGSKQD